MSNSARDADVDAALERVRALHAALNANEWCLAPCVAGARRATWRALKYEDRPRGRPSARLLAAALAAFAAVPAPVRRRVESGGDAEPYVPDHVRQRYTDLLGRDLFDRAGAEAESA